MKKKETHALGFYWISHPEHYWMTWLPSGAPWHSEAFVGRMSQLPGTKAWQLGAIGWECQKQVVNHAAWAKSLPRQKYDPKQMRNQLTFQIGPVAIAIILVSFASLFGFISLLRAWYEPPKTLPSEAKGVLVGCVRSWWQLSGTCGICSSLHRLYLDLSSLLCVFFISFFLSS